MESTVLKFDLTLERYFLRMCLVKHMTSEAGLRSEISYRILKQKKIECLIYWAVQSAFLDPSKTVQFITLVPG